MNTRNYFLTPINKWELKYRLKMLHDNIAILVSTKEVNQLQRAKLREYMRTLKRRLNKLDSKVQFIQTINPKPDYIEVGDGC